MGSRGSGRKDGWEGGVNLLGLESFLTTLGALLEDAERSKVGKGVRRRGRRRRRWIADIVADTIRDLEMFAGGVGGVENYICQEPRETLALGSRMVTRVGVSDCVLYLQSLVLTPP